MKIVTSLVLVIAAAALALVWIYPKDPATTATQTPIESPSNSEPGFEGPIKPIPLSVNLDDGKVQLGKKLFNDPMLSQDNSVSCASCHNLSTGGSNGLAFSVGINGAISKINVPTVFNSSLNFKQFWDGRADNLEEQIDGPIENPLEMGSNWPEVIRKLNANPEYKKTFSKLYSEGITQQSVSHAIAEFERSLLTPNSLFDQYLRGDELALSKDELAGYDLFLNLGCVRCHQGVGIGGNMFQRMGAKNDYFNERGKAIAADLGRFNVTKDEFDKYRFKVPSLRNIALTAPYFHDGSASNLDDAVAVMARYQLGRRLKDDEQRLLVAFLKSLTGEYQGNKLTSDLTPTGGDSK